MFSLPSDSPGENQIISGCFQQPSAACWKMHAAILPHGEQLMSIYLHISHPSPVSIWGMTSGERIERLLGLSVIPVGQESLASLLPEDSVLLIRGDYLFDDRLIKHLGATPALLLQLDAPGQRIVAAHVAAGQAMEALALLDADDTGVAVPAAMLGDVQVSTPADISVHFQSKLRKSEAAFVLPITARSKAALEQRLFDWSYKGVTDLVTKWVWPWPARHVVAWCVRRRFTPNQVTFTGFLLVLFAGICFANGFYAFGLLAGWLMTFLDTVDGKLARVTLTSSRFGHYFDHIIDIVHPPLWYMLWGLGLPTALAAGLSMPLTAYFWLLLIFYIGGRLVEGSFQWVLGRFGIFCWQPFDSYFRLITARRNPSLILLTASLLIGRPDLGLVTVTAWTVLSTILLFARLIYAVKVRRATKKPLRSWLLDVDSPPYAHTLAARIFTGRARQNAGP